ncbi:MAG: DMT family transporter, partial [Methylococcales bacterium]
MNDSTSSIPDNSAQGFTGAAFVLIAALGFSAKAILIKLAYAGGCVDAISLLALRMAMSLPFFLAAAIWLRPGSQVPSMTGPDWLSILALGILGYYFSSFLDFEGLVYISAGLERLILFLYPTLVVLFSALLYRKRVHFSEVRALGFSYAGIGLVVFENIGDQSGEWWIGTALVFASAISFACYMMGSGVMVRRIGSFRFTCYSMIVACLATGLHFGLDSSSRLVGLPVSIYGLALLMALLSTVLPAFFMSAGIHRLGSRRASMISSAGPVGTLLLAYLLLDEQISPIKLAGTGLVLFGVYLTTRSLSDLGETYCGGGKSVHISDHSDEI